MPEGDTIAWTANRLHPVRGRVPESIEGARNPDWSRRLAGQQVTCIDTHGKHLFVHFESGLVIHSHLGMTGYWSVVRERPSRAATWLVIQCGERWWSSAAVPRSSC